LPSRGSIQDRLLRETIERERFTEYSKTLFVGRMLSLAMRGGTPATFKGLEEELSLAVFQTAFDPAAVEAQLQRLQKEARARHEEQLRDARILARVASYSEKEEDQVNTAHEDVFEKRLAERRKDK